jgi:ketosteroid isomerase-like protein
VKSQQDHQSQAAIEDEIHALSLEKFRWKTEGHFHQLSDLFDDDLVFVHLNGFVTSKQEWISQLKSRMFVYDRIDLEEASVRVYGDTAVLVGKARFAVNGGSVYKLVYTEVYTKKNDQWKLVNLHTCSGSF